MFRNTIIAYPKVTTSASRNEGQKNKPSQPLKWLAAIHPSV